MANRFYELTVAGCKRSLPILNVTDKLAIAGFIMLIVFSFSSANINRRSYARSYWCWLILCVIIVAVVLIIAAATVGIGTFFDRLT